MNSFPDVASNVLLMNYPLSKSKADGKAGNSLWGLQIICHESSENLERSNPSVTGGNCAPIIRYIEVDSSER